MSMITEILPVFGTALAATAVAAALSQLMRPLLLEQKDRREKARAKLKAQLAEVETARKALNEARERYLKGLEEYLPVLTQILSVQGIAAFLMGFGWGGIGGLLGAGWSMSRGGARQSLALKEKDAMQVAMMNLGVMSKLYMEKKSYASLYLEKIEEYDIRYRYYDRIDKKLFEESLTGEAREKAKAIGTEAKDYMVETFRSLTTMGSPEEARRTLQALVGDRVAVPRIERVFWAGDGTYIDFGNLWFELRASGTDAVLRFYIEGKEKELLKTLNQVFVGIAEAKLRALGSRKQG